MDSLTEREAIQRFLAAHAALATLERKTRRVERVVFVTYGVAILANVTLPAVGGFQPLDLLNYALACLFALSLRRWIIAKLWRRRAWALMQTAAAHARARLAFLDGRSLSRPERPRMPA